MLNGSLNTVNTWNWDACPQRSKPTDSLVCSRFFKEKVLLGAKLRKSSLTASPGSPHWRGRTLPTSWRASWRRWGGRAGWRCGPRWWCLQQIYYIMSRHHCSALQPPTLLHHIAHDQLGLGLQCEFAPDFAPRFINIQILKIMIISVTLAHFVHKI